MLIDGKKAKKEKKRKKIKKKNKNYRSRLVFLQGALFTIY